MKNIKLIEEIAKGVSARQTTQFTVTFDCDSKKDAEKVVSNITELLSSQIEEVRLAKITFEYDLNTKKVVVEFNQHT